MIEKRFKKRIKNQEPLEKRKQHEIKFDRASYSFSQVNFHRIFFK